MEIDRCIEVYADPDQLKRAAAKHWIEICAAAIQEKNACHIALAGGSTPKMLYQLLTEADYRDSVDWQRVHIYFGDERHVPHDHEQSNFRMAREAFLDSLDIPESQIHAIPYLPDAKLAAAAYAQTLQNCLALRSGFPCFDLVWLGMGDDGHTASLFPGSDLLSEQTQFCSAAYIDKLSSWRISVTFPVINNAENVLMLISGAGKAERMAEVLHGGEQRYPVQSVAPRGMLCWLLDAAAAQSIDWKSLHRQWRVIR